MRSKAKAEKIVRSDELPDCTYKITIVGEPGVGKSALIERIVNQAFFEFQQPTIGSIFQKITFEVLDKIVRLEIWDNCSSERYKSLLISSGFIGTRGLLIVYRIDDADSFKKAKEWLEESRRNIEDLQIIFVGAKCDLESKREVDYDEAKSFADQNDLLFFETSAKDDINVDKVFMELAKKLTAKFAPANLEKIYQDFFIGIEKEPNKKEKAVEKARQAIDVLFENLKPRFFELADSASPQKRVILKAFEKQLTELARHGVLSDSVLNKYVNLQGQYWIKKLSIIKKKLVQPQNLELASVYGELIHYYNFFKSLFENAKAHEGWLVGWLSSRKSHTKTLEELANSFER